MPVDYVPILNAIKDAKDFDTKLIILASLLFAGSVFIANFAFGAYFKKKLKRISYSLSVLGEIHKPAASHKYKILTVLWIRVKDIVFNFCFPNEDTREAIIDSTKLQEYQQKMNEAFIALYKDRVFFSEATFKKYEDIFTEMGKLLGASPVDTARVKALLEELTKLVRAELGINFTPTA